MPYEKPEDSFPTFNLQRQIPIEENYDVVVLGGGPGGTGAAISAGRLGARVLLVEATGCLGGMGTSGLVTAFDPMGNGEEMLVGGLMKEIADKLYDRGELGPMVKERKDYQRPFMRWTPFKVEGYKRLLDELCIEAGVEIRFFTRLIDADADPKTGKVHGAILHNIEGYRYIRGKTFIDATGDAVLADACGAECREAGRDTPHIMPASFPSLFAGIDWEQEPRRYQHDRLMKALEDGHFSQPDKHMPGMSHVSGSTGYLNGGHLFNLNALRCKDLSEGVMFGRRLACEYRDFFRKYVDGCKNLEHVTTASLIGVRESRRIVGEYEVNLEDFQARRLFPDAIGRICKFIDIHPYDNSDEQYERFQAEHKDPAYRIGKGEAISYPYGILVPKGWSNLWVAGRTASADLQMHGVIRVQPCANNMGQAAGTAAVQSIHTGQPACDLNTETLIETLREHQALLPQKTLTKQMTRPEPCAV